MTFLVFFFICFHSFLLERNWVNALNWFCALLIYLFVVNGMRTLYWFRWFLEENSRLFIFYLVSLCIALINHKTFYNFGRIVPCSLSLHNLCLQVLMCVKERPEILVEKVKFRKFIVLFCFDLFIKLNKFSKLFLAFFLTIIFLSRKANRIRLDWLAHSKKSDQKFQLENSFQYGLSSPQVKSGQFWTHLFKMEKEHWWLFINNHFSPNAPCEVVSTSVCTHNDLASIMIVSFWVFWYVKIDSSN